MDTPQVKFRSGFFVHRILFKQKYNKIKLDSYLVEFEKYFREREKLLMEEIKNVTGLPWNVKQIDVYLFDAEFPSISFPLCLNYHGGHNEFSLFCIIHELTHNILFYNWHNIFGSINISAVEIEAICEFVTKKVCKKFFDDISISHLAKHHEFKGFYKCVWEREQELEREIGEKTLLKFFYRADNK